MHTVAGPGTQLENERRPARVCGCVCLVSRGGWSCPQDKPAPSLGPPGTGSVRSMPRGHCGNPGLPSRMPRVPAALGTGAAEPPRHSAGRRLGLGLSNLPPCNTQWYYSAFKIPDSDSGKSGMGMGVNPRSPANRGWGWGWTPDSRKSGAGPPNPDPRQIADGDGDGDRGFRALH
jgi:hypothetical protein